MTAAFRSAALAFAADVVCVIAFVSVGRRNHAEGVTLVGIAETAWPFLTGTVVGWLVSRGWRRPATPVPTGLIVWVCTVVVGMALRVASGEGIAFSFILVATLVTGVLLVGWRAVRAGLSRRTH
ncbi:MAG: DUF3054 domain-containing protein [Mycobacterium sp.]